MCLCLLMKALTYLNNAPIDKCTFMNIINEDIKCFLQLNNTL